MTYIDPRNGDTINAADQPLGQLIAWLFHLSHGHSAREFVRCNHPEVIKDLVRHVRARHFQKGEPITGRIRAMLNSLDPPRCACGGKGLYIVGPRVYCSTCKDQGVERLTRYAHDFHDKLSTEIANKKRARDYKDLSRDNLHRVKATPRK